MVHLQGEATDIRDLTRTRNPKQRVHLEANQQPFRNETRAVLSVMYLASAWTWQEREMVN